MFFGNLLTEWIFSRMSGAAKSLGSCTHHVRGSEAKEGETSLSMLTLKVLSLFMCIEIVFNLHFCGSEQQFSNEISLIPFQPVLRDDEVWWKDT